MTQQLRTRRLALLVASTAIAAGGVLVPTTAFAAAPTAPQGRQCFRAPCEQPGQESGRHDKWNQHDKWNGHDKWNHHDKRDHRDRWERQDNWNRHDKSEYQDDWNRHDKWNQHDKWNEHDRPGGEQQWQCFAAPCEPPSGAWS